MAYSVTNWTVDHTAPKRILTAARYERAAQITNVGLAPAWLGHADVLAGGAGVQILPGDPPYVFDDVDELYAVSWSATELTVIEFLAGSDDS